MIFYGHLKLRALSSSSIRLIKLAFVLKGHAASLKSRSHRCLLCMSRFFMMYASRTSGATSCHSKGSKDILLEPLFGRLVRRSLLLFFLSTSQSNG